MSRQSPCHGRVCPVLGHLNKAVQILKNKKIIGSYFFFKLNYERCKKNKVYTESCIIIAA